MTPGSGPGPSSLDEGRRPAQGIVAELSRETLRRILRAGGVSWQTTTCKASTDRAFIAKMRQALDLYDHPPADGRVVRVDEFGPLSLLPRKGKAWRSVCEPRRLWAAFTRMCGVMHMLAALRYFARGGTDHHSHATQNAAIAAYVRRRNARTQPKAGFAVGSPIRTCTDHHDDPVRVLYREVSEVLAGGPHDAARPVTGWNGRSIWRRMSRSADAAADLDIGIRRGRTGPGS